MNEALNRYNQKELSGRDARLWTEWYELDKLCEKRRQKNPAKPSISYIIRRKNVLGLPTEYEIRYRVKSIVGVEDTPPPRRPIFGELHKMSIVLPNNYPAAVGNPIFTFLTDTWHPNIRSSGSSRGHVCLTIREMGVLASLRDLVVRVERYLTYQLYHAQNIYPYPEDQNVAEWVRDEAEPQGWLKFSQTDGEPEMTPPPLPPDLAGPAQSPAGPPTPPSPKPTKNLTI